MNPIFQTQGTISERSVRSLSSMVPDLVPEETTQEIQP
jgi:hypothetical protein